MVTCHKFAPLPWTSLFLGAPCTQASKFFEAFHWLHELRRLLLAFSFQDSRHSHSKDFAIHNDSAFRGIPPISRLTGAERLRSTPPSKNPSCSPIPDPILNKSPPCHSVSSAPTPSAAGMLTIHASPEQGQSALELRSSVCTNLQPRTFICIRYITPT